MDIPLAALARLWVALHLLRAAAFVAGGEAGRTVEPNWTGWEPIR